MPPSGVLIQTASIGTATPTHHNDPLPSSVSERFKNIALGVAGIITSIAIPGVGLWIGFIQKDKETRISETQKDRELQKSYVELGIRILSDPPRPEAVALRKWALELVNTNSTVKMTEAAESAVINSVPLTINPEFGPAEGSAQPGSPQALLNRQKNRSDEPQAQDFDASVDLHRMLAAVDEHVLNQAKAATIEGYVLKVHLGGPISANMNSVEASRRDIFISVAPSLESGPEEQVICIVTPRFRAKHGEWSLSALSQTLVNKRCRISGWLLFNFQHFQHAANNPQHGGIVFSATAWQLHPVTAIEPLN